MARASPAGVPVVGSLGYLAHRTGEHALALAHYGQALTLRRGLGDAFEEADTLAKPGDVHDCLDRSGRAPRHGNRPARSASPSGASGRPPRSNGSWRAAVKRTTEPPPPGP
ncbi:tetratricopeptide repeat protein [Streptomyces sp. NPDC046881]|uniref:tetratricopeptide repeat protein n=1 Tax=Streptomyces sp. NPDC046881 TaxID=3155374 RepID=UPI0033C1C5B6